MYEEINEDTTYTYCFYYQKKYFKIDVQSLDIVEISKTHDIYEFLIKEIKVYEKGRKNPLIFKGLIDESSDFPVDLPLFKQELEAAFSAYETGSTNWSGLKRKTKNNR